MKLNIGTKSVLYGAHCFFIHPFFVMIAWFKLYGFPLHPAIWVSFFFHDLGYWGKPNMDGAEGETHVEFGAKVLGIFDRDCKNPICYKQSHKHGLYNIVGYDGKTTKPCPDCYKWQNFSKYHSRFYAKKDGVSYSKLCVADKLAITLEPHWLYLPRVNWTGEIKEYMKLAADSKSKNGSMKLSTENQLLWYKSMGEYLKKWVIEHKEIKEDTWTPDTKKTATSSGVWQ